MFDWYCAVGTLTKKSHALNQIYEGVSHVGEMKSLHTAAFEASHKKFKSLYANSSRRKRTFVGKVVSMQDWLMVGNSDGFINNRVKRKFTK